MNEWQTPQMLLAAGGLIVLLAALMIRAAGRRRKRAQPVAADGLVGRELLLRVLVLAHGQKMLTGQKLDASAKANSRKNGVDLPNKRGPVRFVIDAVQLAASYRYVCGQNSQAANGSFQEVFHWAAGIRIDEFTYVITKYVPVKYARQSASGALVDDASNAVALGMIDDAGLILLAHFHSHPGFGRDANHPSAIDRRFQERLERGSHIAIGGIFSRDGFVRFFAGDLDRFVVDVFGNGIKKVGDNEFRVLEVGDCQLSHDAFVGHN